MISIDQVIKNQSLTNEKFDFKTMNLTQLNYYYKKYKSLQLNKSLVNSLKDKGEKIAAKLVELELLIKNKCNNVDSSATIEELMGNLSKIQLSNDEQPCAKEKIIADIDKMDKKICEKIETYRENLESRFKKLTDLIDDEKARQEILDDLNSASNIEKLNEKYANDQISDNYFLLKESRPNHEIKKQVKAQKSLNEIKLKIIQKHKQEKETRVAKTIPLCESIKLIKEQTHRIQELQMQIAADKIRNGCMLTTRNSNFDYSFAQKSATHYRDKKCEDAESDNEELNSCSDCSSDNESNEEFNFQRASNTSSERQLKYIRKMINKSNDDEDDDEELNKLD